MNGNKNDSTGKQPVVRLGRLQFKADVPAQLTAAGVTLDDLLRRHQDGDWGMVDDDDREYQDWLAAHGKTVTSTFIVWIEGKARSVFVTTEGRTTYVVVV